MPLVSVIMCVYNAGSYLRSSVESVLAQTYRNIELLIIDDGSSDGCMNSIADLQDERIRIIKQENRGKPAAMNVALEAMRGEFYALNDADDLSDPHRIQQQVKFLAQNSEVAGVFCGYSIILNGREMAPLYRSKNPTQCRRDIDRFRMPGHDPTAMYRMSMVREIRYSVDLPIVEGFDYILRVGEQYPLVVLPDCLYRYRIHNQSVTKKDPARRDTLVEEVLARACKRREIDPATVLTEQWQRQQNRRHSRGDNNLAAHFMESVCDLKDAGQYGQSLLTGLACARLHPFDPYYYRAALYAILPKIVRRRVRRSERNS